MGKGKEKKKKFKKNKGGTGRGEWGKCSNKVQENDEGIRSRWDEG